MTTESPATPEQSKGRMIGYWLATGMVALPIGGGGVVDVLRPPEVVTTFQHLGYPLYFAVMLGIWKILGTLVLLAPGFRRAKEWAYAGIVIDLVGAAVSHAAVGDGPDKLALPLVLMVALVASHQLRPASRRL